MLRWYQTVFNARVQYLSPALAFLTFDDEHHRFALANMSVFQPDGSNSDRQGAIGVDHLGYSYSTLRELLENYALLKAVGIPPYWCIHHGITASLYYADADGNQMEFQVDCLDSSADASAFMDKPVQPESARRRVRPGGLAHPTPRRYFGKSPAGAQSPRTVSPLRGSIAQYIQA